MRGRRTGDTGRDGISPRPAWSWARPATCRPSRCARSRSTTAPTSSRSARCSTRCSASIEAVVHHCMEKNPRERFQSARDLAFQLRMLPEVQNSRTDNLKAIAEPESTPRRLPIVRGAAVALLALAAAGFALFRLRGGATQPMPRTYKQLTYSDGLEMFPTLAPDGTSFAYVSSQSGNRDIYVQRVDGRTAVDITSDSSDDDSEPAFSPDGSQIAFRSERD